MSSEVRDATGDATGDAAGNLKPPKSKRGRKPVKVKKDHEIMARLTEPDFYLFDRASGDDPLSVFLVRMAKLGLEKSTVPWERIIAILGRMFIWWAMLPRDAKPTQEQLETIWERHILCTAAEASR